MNKRKLKLSEYGISENRYDELIGFCHQYPEWRDELKYKTDTIKSMNITDMPISHNTEDATSSLAIRRMELVEKCNMIEKAAVLAGGYELYEYIIKGVAYKKSVWYLIDIMGMPMSANAFYDMRKLFFINLNEIKK